MIQIESIRIENMRGIKDLTLEMGRKNFVVSGPNGTGKSGIVDAIQFALTGEIGRLKGSGTGDISLSTHGPHVDNREDPATAQVTLKVFLPSLNKSAVLVRGIKNPRKPKITPKSKEVTDVIAQAASHPEVILSRREIIKFILTEAGQRSKDVQTLLKLESVEQARAALKSADNGLGRELKSACASVLDAAERLRSHVDISELNNEKLLEVINQTRASVELAPLQDLKDASAISSGLTEAKQPVKTAVPKETSKRDIEALSTSIADEEAAQDAVTALLADIKRLNADPALLHLLQRQSFLEAGLELIDEATCPLCDTEWDIEELRSLVADKIKKSKEAGAIKSRLLSGGITLAAEITRLAGSLSSVQDIKEVDAELVVILAEWSRKLSDLKDNLGTIDGILTTTELLQSGWKQAPAGIAESLTLLDKKVDERPEKSPADNAAEFLAVARERLGLYQELKRDELRKRAAASRAKAAYKAYCEASEEVLASLYGTVEGEFADYYRLVNSEDEDAFVAELKPEEGKLGLLVDFYKKGMFPPAAYHSEGHQDGMGICLYLALMNHLMGSSFTLAVLDDVVMSVDSRHRKHVCSLLKEKFPETQFVITTHDGVWAQQIRSHGLVTSKNAVAFHSWSVDTGPVLGEVVEAWEKIDAFLEEHQIPSAAHLLRRHLEYVSTQLADELGASVPFRADGGYDMGDLLSAVIGRQGELLKKAKQAAKSWNQDEEVARIDKLITERTAALGEKQGEQWAINKAVHYNEWADLSAEDFRPVVSAFKKLLNQFKCDTCDGWIAPSSRRQAMDLRCACGVFRMNLKKKPS